jgi:hypothetical protein
MYLKVYLKVVDAGGFQWKSLDDQKAEMPLNQRICDLPWLSLELHGSIIGAGDGNRKYRSGETNGFESSRCNRGRVLRAIFV